MHTHCYGVSSMHGLKQTDSKYSGTSHGDRKSGAFSLFSSKESSSPPTASSSLPVRHILIVCLFYLEYIFPSSVSARLLPCCVPDRLAFLNDRLSLWEASSYSCEPFALQYEGKSMREGRGERERGVAEWKERRRWRAAGKGQQWERKGDLKRENKSSLRSKWLRKRAFFSPDTTQNYERKSLVWVCDTVITWAGREQSHILKTRRRASWFYQTWLMRSLLSVGFISFSLYLFLFSSSSHFCLTSSPGLACWHASAQPLSTSPQSGLEFTVLTAPIH